MSDRLATVLDLTERVQAALDAGDWQRAREIEDERRAALEQLVLEQAAQRDLGGALAELYARNQRLIGEVEHHRRALLRDATMIRTGKEAVAAYVDAQT